MYQTIQLSVFRDERGDLIPLESNKDVPFDIKRAFCIFNVNPNARRAQHANMVAQEFLICLSGTCNIHLDNGKGEKATITLNGDSKAVCIEPKIWLELSDFSADCVILVMSDHYYDRQNQIRDYATFLQTAQ